MILHRSTVDALRLFMLLEAASFGAASLIHAGAFIFGYEHTRASVAEGVIALLLFFGLAWSWIAPAGTREVSLVAQSFALMGTLVGLFTIIIGVGPRTVPDLVYYTVILVVLMSGLLVAARALGYETDRHRGR